MVLFFVMETLEIKEIVKRSVASAIEICETQVLLAEKTGVSQGAISKYLRGAALPRGEIAKKLSRAVGGQLKPYDFAPHIFDSQPVINSNPTQTHHESG